jgi:shikimate kinase
VQLKGKLIFLCGKMAAGKSTLSKALAEREDAVLLVEDEFIERLSPGEIVDVASFVGSICSYRNRACCTTAPSRPVQRS